MLNNALNYEKKAGFHRSMHRKRASVTDHTVDLMYKEEKPPYILRSTLTRSNFYFCIRIQMTMKPKITRKKASVIFVHIIPTLAHSNIIVNIELQIK